MEPTNMIKPNNNMALAIFTTLCCCLPTGIYAIIRASKVNDFWVLGLYNEAYLAAQDAKKWSIIGIVLGLVWQVFYWVFWGFASLAAMGASVDAGL